MSNAPIILIELVMTLGGVIAFAVWQFRELERDKKALAERRAREAAEAESDKS